MHAPHYQRLPSQALGRRVHMWSYGWFGHPVVVFPSAAGMAHEWQASGAFDALRPLVEAGRVKLYCPESNVSEAWTSEAPVAERMAKHRAYERFIQQELVAHIRQDCGGYRGPLATAGCSFGAFYAANTVLKAPETFTQALCLSGRYRTSAFLDGLDTLEADYNRPLAYLPNLSGHALERVRRHVHLTLVVGTGAHEGRCVEETHALADALAHKGISHERDVWGADVSHEWVWWRRQLAYHMARLF